MISQGHRATLMLAVIILHLHFDLIFEWYFAIFFFVCVCHLFLFFVSVLHNVKVLAILTLLH